MGYELSRGFLFESVVKVLHVADMALSVIATQRKDGWGALGVWGGGVNKVHCVLLSESVATLKMLLCLQVIATLT